MSIENRPHKAVVRLVVEIFPLEQTGEMIPLPSSITSDTLDELYGSSLEEAQKAVETWKMNQKKSS